MRSTSVPATPDNDTLGHYREVIFYWFAVSTSVSLSPFVALAFYNGHAVLGAVVLCLVLVFVVDALFMHMGKAAPIPPIAVFLPIIISLAVAIAVGGVYGVVWGYPALMLFQFLLKRWVANLLSLVMIVVVTGFSFWYLGQGVTLRVAVTLLLTLAFANVFMGVMLELQRRLEQHAIMDPLTGTHNRRHFELTLERAVASLARSGRPASLLLIDIDHFKSINDELGHAAGDQVLKDVVDIVRDTIRQTDMLFRIGGEEFAVLLADTSRTTAAMVAEKIRVAVADTGVLNNRSVTISIGFDEISAGDRRSALLERCDIALYRAKERGRNRVEPAGALPARAADGFSLAG